MSQLDKELRERIEEPVSDEAEREARLSPADAVAQMRIKVPAQRSRKLRTVLERVNADEEPDRAAQYDVLSLPTCVLLVDGELRGTVIGVRPLAHFTSWLDEVLPAAELGTDS